MRIHFIGIGGIGVSALAQYYIAKGHNISGSDLTESEITTELKRQGAKIRIGPHRGENIPFNADLVIYSPAVKRENLELAQANNVVHSVSTAARWKSHGQPKEHMRVLSYPEALGELTQEYYTIAISGTHGKSTTTAMIGLILIAAGFDPTVIVGTKVKEFNPDLENGTNCRVGQDTFFVKGRPVLVIEADEHFASFLNYVPDIIVLTSVEPDHLDYYKNLQNIIKAFKKYIQLLPKDGVIVANKDDRNIPTIIEKSKHLLQLYSAKWKTSIELRKILQVPGEYNVSNAHAAITLARILQVPDTTSFKTLSNFKGTWRRFEVFPAFVTTSVGTPLQYTLVSDYGHHPTEVRVTVQAARDKWPEKKIWLVFQPHQFQRTFFFFRDFISMLARLPVDKIIVADIYDVAGREEQKLKEQVSSQFLVKGVIKKKGRKFASTILHIPTTEEIEIYLQENLQGNEVVMVMGAGDIYDLTRRLTQKAAQGKME